MLAIPALSNCYNQHVSVSAQFTLLTSYVNAVLHCVAVVCADGSFYKYGFTAKGECRRELYAQFLEMGEDT